MEKYEIFKQMMNEMDKAYDVMYEYDSLLHKYGNYILYQVESHMIQMIGRKRGITNCELAETFGKTKSACSQIVKKLVAKGWVKKIKNADNRREYNIYLTEEGKKIFENHEEFDKQCYDKKYKVIQQFSMDELNVYLKIQRVLNETFCEDLRMSHEYFEDDK